MAVIEEEDIVEGAEGLPHGWRDSDFRESRNECKDLFVQRYQSQRQNDERIIIKVVLPQTKILHKDVLSFREIPIYNVIIGCHALVYPNHVKITPQSQKYKRLTDDVVLKNEADDVENDAFDVL